MDEFKWMKKEINIDEWMKKEMIGRINRWMYKLKINGQMDKWMDEKEMDRLDE